MKHSTRLRSCSVACAALSAVLGWSALTHAMPGEVSFTPTGFKLSVMRIVLSATDANGNPTSQAVLYSCPASTEEECLVDVTDQASLDSIAAAAGSAKVHVGTYDSVSMEMCAAGKNGMTPAPGFIRGSFTIASEHKTYVTSADAADAQGIRSLAEGDSVNPDFTKIGNWSCNTKTVHLPKPVTVSAGTPTDLTVVVDPKLIAFSTPNTSGGMGGCRGQEDGRARGFCVSYPSIISLVSEGAPELDRFLVAHHRTDPALIDDSKANAYVVVVRSATTLDPITAFVRPYYSETSASASSNMVQDMVYGGPAYFGETLVGSVHVTPTGGIDFVTGGSLDGNSAMFKNFTVDDHKGVVDTRELGSYQYHAIPISPGEGGAGGVSGAEGGSGGAGGESGEGG